VPGEDATLAVIALLLMGAGAILGVSLAFLAVGRSEDEERAREERRGEGRRR
jgi:hypothetical protein